MYENLDGRKIIKITIEINERLLDCSRIGI
jgi:hypothetical protein